MRSGALWAGVSGVLLAASALAQTTGQIEGRTVDSAGAPIGGVSVQASGATLQGTRTATSARDGLYRLPALAPGPYRLTVSLEGFRCPDTNVLVSLDATATAELILYPVAQADVSVTGEAPLLDHTSTTVGTSYPSGVIGRLPVSRNYADIVRSNPAVESDRGETQGRSLALAINGATSAENLWIIDGVNTTNVVKGTQGKAINVEFVQEVEVKTGGYQAEYGRALGGIINVITKSGGNEFHGDAFGYYDGSSLQARRKVTSEDSLISEMQIVDYRRTDVGADLGGYIVRDRVWFFGAYDRVALPAQLSRYVATDLVSIDDRFPLDATDDLYSAKLTWNIASGSSVVGTLFADPTTNSGAGGADPRQGFGSFRVPAITNRERSTWDSTRHVGSTDYAVRASQLFGASGLLVAQGSRHQDRYELEFSDAVRIRDLTCEGGTPEAPCSPIENFVTGGYGSVYGPDNGSHSTRDQFRGDLSLYLGSHEVKVGGDYQDGKTYAVSRRSGGQTALRFNERGTLYYQHNFYSATADPLIPTDWTTRPRVVDAGLFAQDSWRAGPGLTINAGLRWDQEEVEGQNGVKVLKTTGEWQPRLGVVWDPWRDGRTKIHASAGRFYYALPTDLAAKAYGDVFFVNIFNFDPLSLVQDPDVPFHRHAGISGGAFGDPVDSNLQGIHQDEVTLGVERLLGPTLSVGIRGTYRRLANTIEDRCDLDYTGEGNNGNSCALMNPGSSGRFASGQFYGCSGLDYPNNCFEGVQVFGAEASPPARRLYRGVEVVLRKGFSERAWLQASYVYSSLRGNYDGAISESFFGQTDPGINGDFDYPQLNRNGYGRLFLDRPHRFRLDGYWTAPFGLSVGLQAFARSGSPLDKFGYLDQWGYVVRLVPRGSAGRTPTEWDANLTLSYPIHVGPVTATLQAYVFNVFNNQNVTGRDTTVSNVAPADYPDTLFDPNQDPTNTEYGKITTRQDPRLVRLALKLSF